METTEEISEEVNEEVNDNLDIIIKNNPIKNLSIDNIYNRIMENFNVDEREIYIRHLYAYIKFDQ